MANSLITKDQAQAIIKKNNIMSSGDIMNALKMMFKDVIPGIPCMRRTSTYFVSSVTASAVDSSQRFALGNPCMRRTSAYFVSSVTASTCVVWGIMMT